MKYHEPAYCAYCGSRLAAVSLMLPNNVGKKRVVCANCGASWMYQKADTKGEEPAYRLG